MDKISKYGKILLSRRAVRLLILLFVIIVLWMMNTLMIKASSEHVIDEMDLLTASEIDQLENEILLIRDELLTGVAIVITDNLNGKSSESYADDYFDAHHMGINGEGLLLLIDMYNRKVWISTAGTVTMPLFQPNIETILDYVTPPLSRGDYFESCEQFLANVRYVINPDTNGTYDNVATQDSNDTVVLHYEVEGQSPAVRFTKTPAFFLLAVVIGLVIGGISTGIITYQSKGKNSVSNRTYEAPNSFNLLRSVDQFTHETVTQRVIQTNNNGGGTHRGSSGTSHGGGGRGF